MQNVEPLEIQFSPTARRKSHPLSPKIPLSPVANPANRGETEFFHKQQHSEELIQAVQAREKAERELLHLRSKHEHLQKKFTATNSMCQDLLSKVDQYQGVVDQQTPEEVAALQTTIDELTEELRQKNIELQEAKNHVPLNAVDLENEIELLKEQISQRDAEVQSLRLGATETQKELLDRTELGIETMRENMNKRCEEDMRTITKLRKEVHDLREANGRLSLTTNEGDQMMHVLETQMNDLKQTLERKNEIIEEYSLRLNSLEKDCFEWKTKFEMVQSTRESLEGIEEKFLQQKNVSSRIEQLERELDESRRSVIDLGEKLRLAAQHPVVDSDNAEVARLQKMLQETQFENQRKLQTVMEDKELMWTARQEVAVLQTKLDNLSSQYKRALEELDELKQKNVNSQTAVENPAILDENNQLKSMCVDLRDRLAQSEHELQLSVAKMGELTSQLENVESEIRDLGAAREALTELEKERDEVMAKYEESLKKCNAIQHTNEDLEYEIMELKEQLSLKKQDYKKRVVDKNNAIKALQTENESLVQDNQTLTHEIDRMEQQQELEANNDDDSREQLLEKLNKLLEENSLLQKNILSLNNDCNKYVSEYEFAMRTCKDQNDKISTLNAEVEELQSQISNQSQLSRLQEENSELREKKQKIQDKSEDLERQLSRLEKQCKSLSESHAEASEGSDRLKKKNKKSVEQNEDLEAELDSIRKQNRRQLDQSQKKIEILELDRQQYENSYRTILSDYERLKELRRQEICNIEDEIAGVDAKWSQEFASLREENSRLYEQESIINQRLIGLKDQLNELSGQNLILESANKKLETDIVDFENAINKISDQKLQTSKLLQTAESTIEMLQTDLNEKDSKIVDLQTSGEQIKFERDELAKRLETTQSTHDTLNTQYKELMANFMKVDNRLQCEIDYTMKVNESNARLTKLIEDMQPCRESVEKDRLTLLETDLRRVHDYVQNFPNVQPDIQSQELRDIMSGVNQLIRSTECDSRAQVEVLCQQIRDLQPAADKFTSLESNLQETNDALVVAQMDFNTKVEEKNLIIDQLELEVVEAREELQSKSKENEDISSKLVANEAKLEEYEESLNQYQSREMEYLQQAEHMNNQIVKLSQQDDQEHILNHIVHLEQELENSKSVNAQLAQEFESYKYGTKQIVDKNQANWAEERKRFKEELKNQENKLSLYLEENQLLEEKLSKTEQLADELKSQLSDGDETTTNDTAIQPQIAELQKALTLSQEQISLLKQVSVDYERLKKDYTELEERSECDFIDLMEERDRLKSQVEDQRKQQETLHAEYMRLHKEGESRNEHDHLMNRIEELEAREREWKESRDRKENEVATLTERANEAEEMMTDLNASIATLEKSEAKLQNQLASERRRFEAMFSEKCALKQEVEFLTNRRPDEPMVQAISNDMNGILESANALSHLIGADELSSPRARPQDLVSKIARYRETVEELETQLMLSNKERDRLQEQLDKFNVKPSDAHKRLSNAMQLIRRMSNENEGSDVGPLQNAVQMLEHYFVKFDRLLNGQQDRFDELEAYREKCTSLEYQLADQTEDHMKLMKDLKDHYKSLMETQNQDLIRAIAQKDSLQRELVDAKSDLEGSTSSKRSPSKQSAVESDFFQKELQVLRAERETHEMHIRTIQAKEGNIKLFVLHMFDVLSMSPPELDDTQQLLETLLSNWIEEKESYQDQSRQDVANLKQSLQRNQSEIERWQDALEDQRRESTKQRDASNKEVSALLLRVDTLTKQLEASEIGLEEKIKDSQETHELRSKVEDLLHEIEQSKLSKLETENKLNVSMNQIQQLTEKEYNLTQKEESRMKELDNLRQEREFLHCQISSFEKRAIEAEQQLEKLRTTGSILEKTLEKDLQAKTAECEEKDKLIKQLQLSPQNEKESYQHKLHTETQNLDKENNDLKQQLQRSDIEKQHLMEEVTLLQNDLSQLHAHGMVLQDDVTQRRHVLEVLNSLFDFLGEQTAESLEESIIYHSENWSKTLMSTIRDLQSCLEKKLNDLQWELSEAQSHVERISCHAQADAKNWQVERDQLLEQVERVKDQYRFQSVDMIKLRESYNESNRKLMRMENEFAQSNKEADLKEYKEDLKEMKRLYETEKKKRQHYEQKCENLEHHSAHVDQSALRTKKTLSQVEMEKHALKSNLHDCKLQRDQAQDQYAMLKTKYDELKKQFWTIKKRYDRMENVLRKKSTSFLQSTPGSSNKKKRSPTDREAQRI